MPLAQVRSLDERLGQQELAGQPIEHVEEAVAIAVEQQLARLAAERGVDEHRRLGRVPVVQVVRRELEVPLQLAGVRIEREDRVRVEVVALALVAVVVGTRIAGRPVEQARFGIVGAGQPGGGAAVLDRLADPRLRAGLAGRGHGPEPPHALAGRGPVRVEESADALVAARDAGDHQIVDDERRAGGAVVLAVVGHLDVPQQLTGEAVQRDQVRVVGLQEHAIAEHGHAAVDPAAGIADQARRARPAVVPDLRGPCARRAPRLRWPPSRTSRRRRRPA